MAIAALVVRLVAPAAVLAASVAALHHALTWRVRGRYFDSDGIRLHYTDEGQGAPVVLLHGLAVQSDLNWRRPGVIKALTHHFRVISLDLRGHGLSDKPHEVAAYGATMAQDVVRLLDHLGIARAHVAGYSLGGFLALKLAAVHQDRLIGAALMGAGWESPFNSAFLDAVPRLAADLEAGHGIAPLSAYLGGERPAPGRLHSLVVRLMTGWFSDGEA
ncbi:MAG: alpha/beta hydrolase, partial [Geminicoccaceae bacterium]